MVRDLALQQKQTTTVSLRKSCQGFEFEISLLLPTSDPAYGWGTSIWPRSRESAGKLGQQST